MIELFDHQKKALADGDCITLREAVQERSNGLAVLWMYRWLWANGQESRHNEKRGEA